MLEDIKKEFSLIRVLVILLVIAVGIYVLGILWQIVGAFSDVIIILIAAWLLSFILEPVVEKISGIMHLPKAWATLLIYLFIAGIFVAGIFLLIPIVTFQIQSILKVTPHYLESAPQFINRWGETIASSLNNSISVIPSVAQFLFSTIIVLILSFYFIVDKDKINREFFLITPKSWHKRMEFIQSVITSAFASFLRVQLIFGLISGVATWIVLRALNIDFAASAAVLAGALAIVPLAGPFLAIIPPVFIALISDPAKGALTFIILLIVQQIVFNVIGPRLLGKAYKINPIIILVSFLVGAKVGGPVGAVLAIPILGVIAVIVREVSHYFLKPEKE